MHHMKYLYHTEKGNSENYQTAEDIHPKKEIVTAWMYECKMRKTGKF